jgi:hypothetical protein
MELLHGLLLPACEFIWTLSHKTEFYLYNVINQSLPLEGRNIPICILPLGRWRKEIGRQRLG